MSNQVPSGAPEIAYDTPAWTETRSTREPSVPTCLTASSSVGGVWFVKSTDPLGPSAMQVHDVVGAIGVDSAGPS